METPWGISLSAGTLSLSSRGQGQGLGAARKRGRCLGSTTSQLWELGLGYFEGLRSLRPQPKKARKGKVMCIPSRCVGRGTMCHEHSRTVTVSRIPSPLATKCTGSPFKRLSKLMLMSVCGGKNPTFFSLDFSHPFVPALVTLTFSSRNIWKFPATAWEGPVSQGGAGGRPWQTSPSPVESLLYALVSKSAFRHSG